MTDRELIQKLNQENKRFRQRAKSLENGQAVTVGTALLIEFQSEVKTHGVFLERAVLTCDMAMGIACASIAGSQVLNNRESEQAARETFRNAARLQKALMPFIETHFKFSSDTEACFNPEAVKEFLDETQKATPLLAQAESLQEYCIQWRHQFAEGLNALNEQA